MPRQIISTAYADAQAERAHLAKTGAPSPEVTADRYKDRIVKLIPGEVVAVYLFVAGLIAATDSEQVPQGPLLTVVFLVLLGLTWPYLARVAGVSNRLQLAISTVAFVVWVFSLGGPFPYLMALVGLKYHPIYGGILLPIYTFSVPILDASYTGPPEKDE
ncbi:MAG TPA: hypothetical protein VFE62_09935 [Gemmataceae bacterium]|nr:hypothetical protein [Gemmataceae bacterium]